MFYYLLCLQSEEKACAYIYIDLNRQNHKSFKLPISYGLCLHWPGYGLRSMQSNDVLSAGGQDDFGGLVLTYKKTNPIFKKANLKIWLSERIFVELLAFFWDIDWT